MSKLHRINFKTRNFRVLREKHSWLQTTVEMRHLRRGNKVQKLTLSCSIFVPYRLKFLRPVWSYFVALGCRRLSQKNESTFSYPFSVLFFDFQHCVKVEISPSDLNHNCFSSSPLLKQAKASQKFSPYLFLLKYI